MTEFNCTVASGFRLSSKTCSLAVLFQNYCSFWKIYQVHSWLWECTANHLYKASGKNCCHNQLNFQKEIKPRFKISLEIKTSVNNGCCPLEQFCHSMALLVVEGYDSLDSFWYIKSSSENLLPSRSKEQSESKFRLISRNLFLLISNWILIHEILLISDCLIPYCSCLLIEICTKHWLHHQIFIVLWNHMSMELSVILSVIVN